MTFTEKTFQILRTSLFIGVLLSMNTFQGLAQNVDQSPELLGVELKTELASNKNYNIQLVLFVVADSKKIAPTQKCSSFETVYGYPKQDVELSLTHDTVITVSDPLPCFSETPSYRRLIYTASRELGEVPGGYDIVWQTKALHNYSYENIDVNLNEGISIMCHIDVEKDTPNYFSGIVSSFPFYTCSGLQSFTDLVADSGGVASVTVQEPMTITSKEIPVGDDPALIAPIAMESEYPTIKPPYKSHSWNSDCSIAKPLGSQNELSLENGPSGFKLKSKQLGRYLLAFEIRTEDEKKRSSVYQRIQQIIIQ
jgi:hypothetical protein